MGVLGANVVAESKGGSSCLRDPGDGHWWTKGVGKEPE